MIIYKGFTKQAYNGHLCSQGRLRQKGHLNTAEPEHPMEGFLKE